MDPLLTTGIRFLSDTGYNVAPARVPNDLIDKPDPPLPEGHAFARVRVHAEGKTLVSATSPAASQILVEWMLAWSVRVWSYIDEAKFRELAVLMHVTDEQASAILASVQIHDDCYFRRPARLEVPPQRFIEPNPEH